MKQISFVLSNNYRGGVARAFYELASVLANQGITIKIFVPLLPYYSYHKLVTLHKQGFLQRSQFWLKLIVRTFIYECRQRFKWVFHRDDIQSLCVRRYLYKLSLRKVKKCDVVLLANNWYQAYESDWLSLLPSTRTYLYVHHIDDIIRKSARKLQMRAFKTYSLITVSQMTRRQLNQLGMNKVHVTTLGVNVSTFQSLNLAEYSPIEILMYASCEKRKGYEVGLAALKVIQKKYPAVNITLVGDGVCQPNLTYHHFKQVSDPQLVQLFQQSSIFIFPSLFEGFGLPPLEAMASGCAVVASDVGAVREYANDNRDLLIVPVGDKKAIVDAVCQLIDRPKQRQRLRRNAVLQAKKFTWQNTARQLISHIYNDSSCKRGANDALQ